MPRLPVFKNITRNRLPVFNNITRKFNKLNAVGKFHNIFNNPPPMLGPIKKKPILSIRNQAKAKGTTLEKRIEERGLFKGGKTRRRRTARRSKYPL